jgi:hypothetical protein
VVELDRSLPHEQYIRRLAAEIRTTWRQMPTVWPGTDFAGLLVLVLDGGLRVIRTDGSISDGRLAEFDQRALITGRFANLGLTRYRGAHAVWVEVPPRAFVNGDPDRWYRSLPRSTSCFATITHEAFHHFGQSGWRDLRAPSPAPERYPPDVEARRRRLETWQALRIALLEPHRQAHHLGAAAWWYQEWKSSSPDEVAAVLDADVRESTAQYVDQTCTVRASIGSNLSPETIDRGHRHLVEQDLAPSEIYAGTAESEAYHVGAIACMLLFRFNHPTWQLDAEDGVPPLESLLGTRLGRPQQPSELVDELLELRVVPRRDRIRRSMERLIRHLGNRGSRLLVFEGLPSSGRTFRNHGVYSVAGFDGVLFMPAVSGDFFVGNGRVAMRELPVVTGSLVTACGCAATALAVPVPEDVTLSAGRLAFRTDDADVDVEVEAMVTDPAGRILLCVPSAARRADPLRPSA